MAFAKRTGITGYSFDHAFLNFDRTSRYAQWAGWRRVMEKLRARMPEIVIDGRQAYQLYGPWSWLAGTYPHPTYNDEQPESFVPFPDLHFDRVSANRERFTAWQYKNMEFAPSEIWCRDTSRTRRRASTTQGELPVKRRTERPRGCRRLSDSRLGLSRMAILADFVDRGSRVNNVLDMIPARDPEEHGHFSREPILRSFAGWLDWTAKHQEYLRHTRTILGQPAIGSRRRHIGHY